ncbi:MAG: thermonuclease family protein [Kiritimatiellae bacterium]|nr:thermonuclease family protein [Kiritimatiellia bacterium]
MKRALIAIPALLALLALPPAAEAITIHRSFRPTQIGVGGGTSVIAPGFSPRKQQIGFKNQAQEQAKSDPPRLLIGRVTSVVDGDSVMVTPNGGVKKRVFLANTDAPELDQPYGADAKSFLSGLVLNKKVEVRYSQADVHGTLCGTLFLKHDKGMVDVNLTMIRNGASWYVPSGEEIAAYSSSMKAAKGEKRGLWAAENPVAPTEWRKKPQEKPKNRGN